MRARQKKLASLVYVYLLLLLVYEVNLYKFINYDDFKMDTSLIINGNFANLTGLVTDGSKVSGWKTRTVNFQFGSGHAYNSNWPQNIQVIELVSDRASIIYQEVILKESFYLLRFDYSARVAYDSQNCDFYVHLNQVEVLYIIPGDFKVKKKEIILKTINGTNVLSFMGISHNKPAGHDIGALISNIQLFALNSNYPNEIEAVALGSTITDSDHIAQNYLLDFNTIGKIQSWCAESCIAGSWIQISSLSIRQWKSVITQGRGDQDSWITKYKVAYTMNGISWQYAENGKIYNGNTDRNTKIVNNFASLINARALKIIIVDFYGNPCARVGATFIQNQISSSSY